MCHGCAGVSGANCPSCSSVSESALALGAVLDIAAFPGASVRCASGISGATLFLHAAGVGCHSYHGCFWFVKCGSCHGCYFAAHVTEPAGFSFAALVLGVAGVSGVTLLRVPWCPGCQSCHGCLWCLCSPWRPGCLLSQVLLLPWLLLLPQVPQVTLFSGAAQAIDADVP